MVWTFPLYLALDTRHMEDPNDSKNTVLKEHLNTTSSLPSKILDEICVCSCFSEYLQGLVRVPPARSYPIHSMCVSPGGSVGPSSFSHLPEHSASDGDTANIALKATPVPWSTSVETKLLFWKLPPKPPKKIIPHWKEGSAGSLLGLVHPWRLWSCDMIPICLHGGLSAALIVCASLCSALMFISLQYLQRDFRNKSLCKWEHAHTIQRNIKIH